MAAVETGRIVNSGGEKWLGKEIKVLDHGFVYLVDYMGGDESIVQAARVSYGRGNRRVSEDRALIRNLMRNDHTSPFEMVETEWHAKMPIFVARQWVRHRTASLNEISGRYSILDDDVYIPEAEVIAAQSKSNKQGRGKTFDAEQAEEVRELLKADAHMAYTHYEYLLNDDGTEKPVDPDRDMLARELARLGLSLNFYTQWYWKMDLHNLLHFLDLRMDSHAQWEIRQYANAMATVVKDLVPQTWEAFVDYRLEAVRLSGKETLAIAALMRGAGVKLTSEQLAEMAGSQGWGKTEKTEFEAKARRLGIL